MRRAALHTLIAVALGPLGCGAAAPAAIAQQGWAPIVVSAIPDTAEQVVGSQSWAPRATPKPPSPRPSLGAKPALMQIAVQDRPSPGAAAPAAAPQPAPPRMPVSESTAFTTSAARQFCVNIADAAADAKFAWQKRALTDLQQDIDKRIVLLEAKAAELQKWMSRRDEFSNKARESLVLIYGRMRPDAAAQQLTAMDEETAAAVLNKLDARISSAILNEMEPAQAARLTGIIAGAARTAPKGPERKKS